MFFIIDRNDKVLATGMTEEDVFKDLKFWLESDDIKQAWTISDFNEFHAAYFEEEEEEIFICSAFKKTAILVWMTDPILRRHKNNLWGAFEQRMKALTE